jgi:hypothetical protein
MLNIFLQRLHFVEFAMKFCNSGLTFFAIRVDLVNEFSWNFVF